MAEQARRQEALRVRVQRDGKLFTLTNRFVRADQLQVFCKRDLPEETRIIEPGMMVTKDFKENRLNVHLKDDGTVSHVVKG